MSAMQEIEWEECLLEPRRDKAVEREIRKAGGFVLPTISFFQPCPWLARSSGTSYRTRQLVHTDLALADLIFLVVSQDNSCRFCYGSQRSLLRIQGFDEERIQRLEDMSFTAEDDPRERLALDFARQVSRANPPPAAAEKHALREAGYSEESVKEIAYVAAFTVMGNPDHDPARDAARAATRGALVREAVPTPGRDVPPLVLSSSAGEWQTWAMKSDTPSYHGYRFPPEIISHAVWLYHRFCVSFRDVEDLLAQRGITVSYEAIRLWCIQFGSEYARRLKRRQGRLGDTWHLDEVFVTIQGQRHYLWRAVDQDGDVIDILVQSRRDRRAAKRFIRKLLKGQGSKPGWLVTDKLRSYRAAHREVMPSVVYSTERYGNNRAEVSHQPTRQRERQMRRFKSPGQAQRFLSVHGLVRNLFHVGRHLLRAEHHRELRGRSFLIWDAVTIAA